MSFLAGLMCAFFSVVVCVIKCIYAFICGKSTEKKLKQEQQIHGYLEINK